MSFFVLIEKNLLMLQSKEEEFDSLTRSSGGDLTLSEEYLECIGHIRDMYSYSSYQKTLVTYNYI